MKDVWCAMLWTLDLVDRKGNPDHGKLAGFVAFTVFVGLILIDRLPPLGHTIVMFAAIFGSRVFIAFLRSRTVTASAAYTQQVTKQIIERRDSASGTEPT